MATAPARQSAPTTAEQLLDLPDDGMRHELVEGVLRSVVPAGGVHGLVAARLLIRVGTFVEARALGRVFAAETGFLLRRDPDTVRAPDLAFVVAERLPAAQVPAFPDLAPDLVAEVVSPHDRTSDVSAKVLAWLDAGVRVVWLVDPQTRTVTTHRRGEVAVLRGDDVLVGGDVLEGFAVSLPDLWS